MSDGGTIRGAGLAAAAERRRYRRAAEPPEPSVASGESDKACSSFKEDGAGMKHFLSPKQDAKASADQQIQTWVSGTFKRVNPGSSRKTANVH